MNLVPSEFAIAEVYFPAMLIATIIAIIAAWATALLLNRFRLSRFFYYPPLVFLSLVVIYTVILGTFLIPS